MLQPSIINEREASGLIERIHADPTLHRLLTEQVMGHFSSMYFKISPFSDREVTEKFREVTNLYTGIVIPYYHEMCFTCDSGNLGPLLQKPSTKLTNFWDSFARTMQEEQYSGDKRTFLSISIAMPINLCNTWKDMSISDKRMKVLFETDLNKVWHQVIRRVR